MIVYDLQCSNGHQFEGWFEDSDAFEEQQQQQLIDCPICNDTHVSKKLSPVAIKTSHSSRMPAPEAIPEKIEALAKKVSDYVENNFENVGCDFAKEALKIHYGVSEARNIRGVSSSEEEKTLREEGVDFIKVPLPAPENESPESES